LLNNYNFDSNIIIYKTINTLIEEPMKTLVLNVDRDDDFGRKAKVKSPIIGIKNNIDAANKLGQADPEDSDLNAIFSAISTYNTLIKEKKKAEIATICGHMNVGLKSDQILSDQLEQVIKKTGADNVVLISDGAEDEYILPIIQSRIKVTSVNRVSVKQSRELEDTYYRVLKILDDEKVQKQFLLPIALVLIVWAVFVILDMASSGFGAILLTLGLYLLIRVFRWEKTIAVIWNEVKSGFLTGKLSVYTSIIAIVIIIANGILAYYEVINTDINSEIELLPVLLFVKNIIWGLVLAGLIAVFGRVVDVYVRDKKAPWRYWIVPFSLFAFGFISTAIFGALYEALINWPAKFDINPFLTLSFIFYTITGIMIALVGAITYYYIKEIYSIESKEHEIEKQTSKLIEKN
jgi:putative membrane protein